MKKQLQSLVLSAIAASTLAINPLSVLAEPVSRVSTTQFSPENNTDSVRESNTVTNTLVATVVNNFQSDISENKSQRINLILIEPFNSFSAGSYLRATINPTEDGDAILIANTLYGNNQILKINAESEVLYGQTITTSNRAQEATKGTATAASLGGLVGTALGEDVETIIQITGATAAIGYATGFLSPQRIQLLNLTKGTPIFFTLKSD